MEYRYTIETKKECFLKTISDTLRKQYGEKISESELKSKIKKSMNIPSKLITLSKRTKDMTFKKIYNFISKTSGLKNKKLLNTISSLIMMERDKCFVNEYIIKHLCKSLKIKLIIYTKGKPLKNGKVYGSMYKKKLFIKQTSTNTMFRVMTYSKVETITDEFFKKLSNVRNLSDKKGKYNRFGLSSN